MSEFRDTICGYDMILRNIHLITLILLLLLIVPTGAAIQKEVRTQVLEDYLNEGEIHFYSLLNLEKDDILSVSVERRSGNLDPFIGLGTAELDILQVQQSYQTEIYSLINSGRDEIRAITDTAERYFLAWDDDSGIGYSAQFTRIIPHTGNYLLILMSNPVWDTFGDYELSLNLNNIQTEDINPDSISEPIAVKNTSLFNEGARIQIISDSLLPNELIRNYRFKPIRDGDKLFISIEFPEEKPLKINLVDFGGKLLAVGNPRIGRNSAEIQYKFEEETQNSHLEVFPADKKPSDTEISYNITATVNAGKIPLYEAENQGESILELSSKVKIGFELDQITEVNQKNENFGVVGNIWMQWTDPDLSFSPDSCNCNKKIYRSIDEFSKAEGTRWPEFTFFNQQERRWTQNQLIMILPDGNTTYFERFWVMFQAPDFNFRNYPFDAQNFFIRIDSIYPEDILTYTPWEEKTRIGNQLGEEEWYITSSDTNISSVQITDTNSRYSFHFKAERHLEYYLFRIFIPILIILLLTYISFLLKDYGKRADIASANLLILVAYSFMIGDDIPRLGYLTFLDIIMVISFVITGMAVIYNLYLKWIATAKTILLAEKIDRIMVWLYPLSYVIALAALFFIENSPL